MTHPEPDPVADFLSAYRAADAAADSTTHAEWRALSATCELLIGQRIRSMVDLYSVTAATAFKQLRESDEGAAIMEAGEYIDHALFIHKGREEHAAYLADFAEVRSR